MEYQRDECIFQIDIKNYINTIKFSIITPLENKLQHIRIPWIVNMIKQGYAFDSNSLQKQ